MNDDPMMVFAGNGSPRLTKRICTYLGIQQGKNETLRFSDGNTFVRILENVRGRRVYIVQTTVFPSNDTFMELLFWIDAFKRAGATPLLLSFPISVMGKGIKRTNHVSQFVDVCVPMHWRLPGPIVSLRWTCTRHKSKASSTGQLTTCMLYQH